MQRERKYNLVFVVSWQDILLPLVGSQTFDQAQAQSESLSELRPLKVYVWILTPLRFCLRSIEIDQLRSRCPGVLIRVIPEINRLKNFPGSVVLQIYRSLFALTPTVFHFRGEHSINRFKSYRKLRRDIFVLDVRGYWPAEFVYEQGFEGIECLPDKLLAGVKYHTNELALALSRADGVVTVSQSLKNLIRSDFGIKEDINVVPCSVRRIHDIDNNLRAKRRADLGITSDEKLLVYSGGYAKYQHLEDLTIPFLNLLLSLSDRIKVLILSHEVEKIKKIVEATEGRMERYLFVTARQEEVADYLVCCDLGFLLRKETLVNRVAQPVKVGEYLAAGVPVCVEGEVGGVTSLLEQFGAGISVHISTTTSTEHWDQEANRVIEFMQVARQQSAYRLASEYFIWSRNIERQQRYYFRFLT